MGGCPKGTSHDVIGKAEDITLSEPLPPITGTITIEGGGHTISGDGKFRIFQVDGGNLTVNNLAMTDGGSDDTGGAIDIGAGDEVSAANSTFAGNSANRGGAIGGGHLPISLTHI